MESISPSPLLLSIIFFIVAFLYSSVGLGGGSSYTAILAIFNVNYLAIPTITLALNLCVTSVSNINYIINHHLKVSLFLPFLVASVPFSYLGGSLILPKRVFWAVLLVCLSLVAIRIYFFKTASIQLQFSKIQKTAFSLFLGALLGFFAGHRPGRRDILNPIYYHIWLRYSERGCCLRSCIYLGQFFIRHTGTYPVQCH
nr:TSUP family transporter [Desulfobulbaceae bacterium]